MKTLITIVAATLVLSTIGCGPTDEDPDAKEKAAEDTVGPETSDPVPTGEVDPPDVSGPDDDQSADDTSNASGAESTCGVGFELNLSGECEAAPTDGAGDATGCTGSSCDEAGGSQSAFCGTMANVYDNQQDQWTVDSTDPVAVETIALEELRLLNEALVNAPDSLVPAFEAWVGGSQQIVDALTASGFDPAAVSPEVIETVGAALAEPQAQVEELVTLECGFEPPDVNEFRREAFAQALRDWIEDFRDDEIDCILEVIDPDALATGPSQEDLVAAIKQCVTPERLEAVEAFQQLGL